MRPTSSLLSYLAIVLSTPCLSAFTIQLDYSLDTNGFFDDQERRLALQAAADRWGDIITQELTAVATTDDRNDVRIGFTHPATGMSYQISSAASEDSDQLAGNSIADEYRDGISIPADTILIFAGGRELPAAGRGGTGLGLNFTRVFDDESGIHNRGFNVGFGSQPMWGGVVTFDLDRNWSFAIEEPGSSGLDFYSIALHEIGHVLGLSISFDDFQDLVVGDSFIGEFASAGVVGGAPEGILIEDPTIVPRGNDSTGLANPHWREETYQSVIFMGGNPNLGGTVGAGEPQDLVMEPIANFTGQIRRLELTRTDVGALRDIGYAVVSEFGMTQLEEWREGFFGTSVSAGDALNEFDFDEDGLPNLLEYGLGLNPTEPNFNRITGGQLEGGSLALTFPFDEDATGVNLIVEIGDDLVSWEPIAETAGGTEFEILVDGATVASEADSKTVGSPNAVSGTDREFVRLRIVEISP